MSSNKLKKYFDVRGWQFCDEFGVPWQIEDLTKADLQQALCYCLNALEDAEDLCVQQKRIFTNWREWRI